MYEFLQKESVKVIIRSIKNGRSVFILGLIISAFGALVSVVIPYLAKLEIDQLVEKRSIFLYAVHFSPFETFVLILGMIFLVSFLEKFFRDVTDIFLREREEIFRHETDIFLYQRIAKMEIGLSLSSNFHNVLRYVDDKLQAIVRTIVGIPKEILGIGIRLFGIGWILIAFDAKVLGIVAIGGVVNYLTGKIQYRNDTERQYDMKLEAIDHTLWSIPWELRRNLTELSRNGAVPEILATFTRNIYEKQRLLRPYQKKQVIVGSVAFLADVFTTLIIKSVVGYTVFYGTGSVGMVTMAVMYTWQLASMINEIFHTHFSLKKIGFDLSFFDVFLKISTPVGSKKYEGNTVGEISFEWVSFVYPDPESIEKPFYDIIRESLEAMKSSWKEPWRVKQIEEDIKQFEEKNQNKEDASLRVLDHFDFSFTPGKIYGIVGKNGAGKTTLISLISGFFRSYEGDIRFGGEDIRDWTVESFSGIISVISQVPYTYRAYGDSTIRINLLLGVTREVSDTEIYELLKDFWLDKKIRQSSRGLDSEIGKDIEFSGGQNQILSIIRILLQDRPILVLDEGTNQLDAENEALVMKHLLQKREGKIILFITHRMNTIARSDEVLCMEHGKITAHGKPADLLKQNDNPYARFYRTQILHEEI